MVYLRLGNKQTTIDVICLGIVCYLLQEAKHFHLITYPGTSGLCLAEAATAVSCLGSQGEVGSPNATCLFVLEIISFCKLVIGLLTSLTHLCTTVLSSGKGTPA